MLTTRGESTALKCRRGRRSLLVRRSGSRGAPRVWTRPGARKDARGRQGKRGDGGIARRQRVAHRVRGRGAEARVAALAEAAQAERVGGGAHLLIEAVD